MIIDCAKIRELRKECDDFPLSWQFEQRKKYLKGLMTDAVLDYWHEAENLAQYLRKRKAVEIVLTKEAMDKALQAILKAQGEIVTLKEGLKGKTPEVTEAMILAAKTYPFERLVQFRMRSAMCVFHEGQTPALRYYPDGNRVWCFACNEGWDTISWVMKQEGIGFKEAVKRLQ